MESSRDVQVVTTARRSQSRAAMIAALAFALAAPLAACSKGGDNASTTTTAKVLETISTLATTTTDDPTNPKPTTSRPPTTPTTAAPTTAAPPSVNGTVTIKPSSVAKVFEYDATGGGASPTLTWDVKLDAGQKLSVHGPAPGTPDVQLSTVTAGSFPLCPGSLVGTTCTLDAKTYTYTVDVKNPDGAVAATKTATLRATS